MTASERGAGLARDFRERPAVYLAPMLFCLAVHWLAIQTWFSADDFAWLGLPLELHPTLSSWLDVFFGPRAQGTVRTLSDRTYFVVLTSLFGLNSAPFRIVAFLTHFANIALLLWIARRLTGSLVSAVLTPVFWCACAGLALSLSWASAYDEICCAFFLLSAFYCLLRYIDTGSRRYLIAQWIAFLLGFGALELNVMYPPIAAVYCWLFARRYFARSLWLFLPSALFSLLHFALVPATHDPYYTMHFDAGLLSNLWHYWGFAAGALRPELIDWRPLWLGAAVAFAMLGGVLWMLIRETRLTLFAIAWFLLVLLPVLPLTHHFTEYYLTIPSIGLALVLALLVSRHPRAATALALLYLTVSIADTRKTDRYFYERARHVKKLVLGLQARHAQIAGKEIIVANVDNDLFWSCFYDDPFRLLGIREVYLAPGSEETIDKHPEWGGIDRFILTIDKAVTDLDANRAEVFAVENDRLDLITPRYRKLLQARYLTAHREVVNAGDAIYALRLGPGWYPLENGYRWMGKCARVQLSGPRSPEQRLFISGYDPPAVLAKGPVTLTLSVDGEQIGSYVVKQAGDFSASFPLPPASVGKYAIEITVEADHTSRIGGDTRELGMIFGTFRIQ